MKMTIATYNICHGANFENYPHHNRDEVHLEEMAKSISGLQADIVGLNEVYNSGNAHLRNQAGRLAEFCGIPYHAFARAITLQREESADYGNAFLSKYEILEMQTFAVVPDTREGDGYYEDRVVLKAVLRVANKPITVLITHFGLNPSEHAKMLQILLPLIDGEENPLILMGDFNLTPDEAYLAPLYERLQDAALVTGKRGYTFSTYEPCQTIDYIFVSKHFSVKNFEVVQTRTSDHFPIKAEVELAL